jgi:hypothetical protein
VSLAVGLHGIWIFKCLHHLDHMATVGLHLHGMGNSSACITWVASSPECTSMSSGHKSSTPVDRTHPFDLPISHSNR